jgi:hypothetical protein
MPEKEAGMAFDYEASLVWIDGQVSPHLGVRFDAAGRFLPEAGNTVVAQVVPGSPTEDALIALRDDLMAMPQAAHFAFTEVASYHMTVFEGVVETRRRAGHWPAGLPLDMSIREVTEAMIGRLGGWRAPPTFAMRITEVTPLGLRLAGATPEDEVHARAWRDRLSVTFGLRTPNHDGYGFHTTLAYCRAGLPRAALPDLRRRMAELTARLQAEVPVMHLARPAFCTFADMNAFPPVHPL